MTTRRFIEITAKSPEEARQLAQRELKEGEIIAGQEVLQAPARGIFGVVGNPETRIRFTCEMAPAPAPAPEPVAEAPRPAPRSEARSEARADSRPPRRDRPAPVRAERAERPGRAEEEDLDSFDDEMTAADDLDAGGDEPPTVYEDDGTGVDVTQDPMWETVQQLLHEVGANLGVTETAFRTYRREGNSVVEVSGANVSQLIGKHGRTLDALQYLMNIVLNKGRDDRTKLILDVQGYREKRHKNLIVLANRMYRKVIDSGRHVELEPMSTLDRRTVHLALKDRAGIETYSRGIEPLRRVVISPKRPASAGGGGGRGRGDRGPRRHDRGEPRENRENRQNREPTETPTKSVPMFLEEEGSNEG
ncbi:MAG: KH domain-containing protein [Candidatus Riflebacteria bacterium]|nr:KH domain-containing protein [Candidatus Riflebacteria bacterium]